MIGVGGLLAFGWTDLSAIPIGGGSALYAFALP
jgi:hypothetical protein